LWSAKTPSGELKSLKSRELERNQSPRRTTSGDSDVVDFRRTIRPCSLVTRSPLHAQREDVIVKRVRSGRPGHNNHGQFLLLTFYSFQNDRSGTKLSECEATDIDVPAGWEREQSVTGNTTKCNRRWIDAPCCAIPMLNESRRLTDVATAVASGCPNIGGRNGADAIQY
jgi:hypothetical protein